jgi:hypothetical protein
VNNEDHVRDRPDTLCDMNDPGGIGGPGQPADQPFSYQDPAAPYQNQPGGWPGTVGQPAPLAPTQGWQQQYQPSYDALMSGEPILVTIGDISVTSTTVYTPSGSRPLTEVSWTFTDMSMTSQAIPTWAIVCAIVFFFLCFLGLLFLLAKENKTTGGVQVTVHGPGFVHTSTIPVYSVAQVADINARVNYVRTLTASAPQAFQAPSDPQGITGQATTGQPWQQNPPAEPGPQDRLPGQSW